MRPGAYHMGKEAVAICNQYHTRPGELIIWMGGELAHWRARAEIAEHQLQVIPNKPYITTMAELKDAVRGIVITEGVMLHPEQKEFFKNLIGELLESMK